MLNFIYYPVSAIMWFWHRVFGFILSPDNGIAWALSVVFLVFTLRLLLLKPAISQVRSMRKMQEFAPQIQKLREKYSNDRQKMAMEMQKLQSEHGVNPLGGCLPMLVQIPVFIGLFHVLRWFSVHDTVYVFGEAEVQSFRAATLFGAPLSASISNPVLGASITSIALVAIPLAIIASIATHFTARHSVQRQAMNPAATSNSQTAIMNKLMLWIFPLFVLFGGPFFPIAILLYWLSNNSWTLAQQHLVYQRIDREESKKKAEADAKAEATRQALAPKPGQKPKSAAKKRPAEASKQQSSTPQSQNGAAPSSAAAGKKKADTTSTAATSDQSGTAEAGRNGVTDPVRQRPANKKSKKRR
ncbi:YidC/Oxa1 family membrane protein insertase [Actinoalloteichus hoggarensis]|uniref:Membrane protein insertase YidC n=1 Tax=Actinoalloteichus hoggarensis TaxID=1470176 RepID=A0A221WD56_9PSEU|nr:membrane protein insertase YidC [Actinoalloteichus hoggarensis]ASO23197.1 Membrane protein insertase YidC [Actinoalloteichus hoggarensis]MBB5922801.1 YidC/Oxa1 family membrane protein insertase [Actinoalloteichus hoggarensis]